MKSDLVYGERLKGIATPCTICGLDEHAWIFIDDVGISSCSTEYPLYYIFGNAQFVIPTKELFAMMNDYVINGTLARGCWQLTTMEWDDLAVYAQIAPQFRLTESSKEDDLWDVKFIPQYVRL